MLQTNLSLNDLPQVTALPLAAGASRGTLTLDGYDPLATNRGVSRIHADADALSATTFTVACERLDDVVDARGVDVVDLVKIDVEGAEDAVLAGMETGLRAHRYRRVLLELHPALLAGRGSSVDACCQVLANAGYVGWTFDHSVVAGRRAAYARAIALRDLLSRADRPPASDPWPHMLWSLPQDDPRSL
jgi:FkbM family methyltransferase